MSVVAKMRVSEVTTHGYPVTYQGQNVQAVEVKLHPVYGDENKSWCEATPSGEMRLIIHNPAASSQFHAGQELFVTIGT